MAACESARFPDENPAGKPSQEHWPHCVALTSRSLSLFVHLSWKKVSKLFPITNFPGILQGRPRRPACQLHPTWNSFLSVFTPCSSALGCVCAYR